MQMFAVTNIQIQESIYKVQQLSLVESAKLFLQYANLNLENVEDSNKVKSFLNKENLVASQILD